MSETTDDFKSGVYSPWELYPKVILNWLSLFYRQQYARYTSQSKGFGIKGISRTCGRILFDSLPACEIMRMKKSKVELFFCNMLKGQSHQILDYILGSKLTSYSFYIYLLRSPEILKIYLEIIPVKIFSISLLIFLRAANALLLINLFSKSHKYPNYGFLKPQETLERNLQKNVNPGSFWKLISVLYVGISDFRKVFCYCTSSFKPIRIELEITAVFRNLT